MRNNIEIFRSDENRVWIVFDDGQTTTKADIGPREALLLAQNLIRAASACIYVNEHEVENDD